ASSSLSPTSGGLGTYTYTYTPNAAPNSNVANWWNMKTTETFLDTSVQPAQTYYQNTVYTNAFGEVMLTVHNFPAGPTNGWETFPKYEEVTSGPGATGRLIEIANPSALRSVVESTPELLNLQANNYQEMYDSTGLVTQYQYDSSTGYYQGHSVQ